MISGLEVTSPVLHENEVIPEQFTCDSTDESPELHISGLPEGTESIALLVEDPDAPGGIFAHWLVFNLPPDTKSLSQGFPHDPELDNGARQGRNSAGSIGYTGPCPPKGTHRYFFRFYALDTMLDLPPGATRREFKDAIRGHILAEGRLMGLYSKRS
jgi:Raf kinase inhibitor-like YbhB/YbcL family protein